MPTTSPDAIYFADAATKMDVTDISLAEANSIQTALNNKVNNRRQIQTYIWPDTAALSTANGFVNRFLSHRPTTAYDGIVIEFSAAQSGTIKIQGTA